MNVWTEIDKVTGVAYTLEVLPEDIPVRGNAMASGDDAEDKRVEDSILRKLRNGDLWAWCTVKCTAAMGEAQGTDYLGCCSYRSTQEFIQPGGYWDDMKAQALADMLRNRAPKGWDAV